MNNILITTLVTSDEYLNLAQLMDYTIKTRYSSKYDFKVMITQNVTIDEPQWIHRLSNYDIIPYMSKVDLNKFWAFTYSEYDYVLFIDIDSFIFSNFDSALELLVPKMTSIIYGNSKLFLLRPNPLLYIDAIKTDSNFLTEYLHEGLIELENSIVCTSSYRKLLLMFPMVARDLMLADEETYKSSLNTWNNYCESHMLFDSSENINWWYKDE